MLHESNPGVIQTMQAASELGRVFLVLLLMLGGITVSTYCKGQTVIALSSGEAECHEMASATSQMLGPQSTFFQQNEEEFMLQIADGTAKLLGRDHEFRESALRREQLGRSEDFSGELQGEPEGFQPTE